MKKIALVLVSLMALTLIAVAADIELKPVESTFLAQVGYDPATQVLAIQMVNSSDVYYYAEVPQAIYDGLLAADSKGAYYVDRIKGHFEATRK